MTCYFILFTETSFRSGCLVDKTGLTAKQNSKSLVHNEIELFLEEHFYFHAPLTQCVSDFFSPNCALPCRQKTKLVAEHFIAQRSDFKVFCPIDSL